MRAAIRDDAASRRKKHSTGVARLHAASALSLAIKLALGTAAWAELPTGANVISGAASFQEQANQLTITQSTAKLNTQWETFNIGAGQRVQFVQPGTDSVALNRVVGNSASSIFGALDANGKVFLVNPNGIVFGQSAQVNVGGLVASTLDIRDSDFEAANYRFELNNGARNGVANSGDITAGSVVLIGPSISNTGNIATPGGNTTLAAGESVTVSLLSNGLVTAQVNRGVINGRIDHSGSIAADGGEISLQAGTADAILDTIINTEGVLQARTVETRNGRVLLSSGAGGTTYVGGTIDTSGTASGDTAGNVTALGKNVAVVTNTTINASGPAGGGTVLIGGNWQGRGPEYNADAVVMDSTATIDASATEQGNGGTVVLWSDEYTNFKGNIAVRAGDLAGDGGRVETSSAVNLQVNGLVDARSPLGINGEWLLDPADINITTSTSGGSFSGGDPTVFTATGGSANVLNTDINAALNLGTNVTITTTSPGGNPGSISVLSPITKSSGARSTLRLNAHAYIGVSAAITSSSASSPLDVVLNARQTDGATGNIDVAAAITTRGGNITIGGGSATGDGYAVGSGRGINIMAASVLDAGGGDITLRGRANTGNGIEFSSGAELRTSGTGNITLDGVAAAGGTHGVFMTANNKLTTDAGNITVTGNSASSTAGSAAGIGWTYGTFTTGTGSINFTGTATAAGVGLVRESSPTNATTFVSTGGGNISLTGRATAGTGYQGIQFVDVGAVSITTNGAGSVTLTGQGGSASYLGQQSAISTYNGTVYAPVTLSSGTGGTLVTGTGSTNARSLTINNTSNFNSTGDVTINGNYDMSTLPNVNAGGNVVVATTAGVIYGTASSVTANGNVTMTSGPTNGLYTPAITKDGAGTITLTGGTILYINGAITKTGVADATLLARAGTNIDFSGGGSIVTGPTAGQLDVTINSRYQDYVAGYVRLGNISTNGGDVIVVGGSSGNGYAINSNGHSVFFSANNNLIDAGGGNILIKGAATASYAGINTVYSNVEVRTSGTGNITLDGTTNAGTSYGVLLTNTPKLTAAAGNITITGATTAATDGYAVSLSGATITTTTGGISITGTAAGVAGGITAATTTITSTSGDIAITGRAASTGYQGIVTTGTGAVNVTTGGAGRVTLTGEGGAVAGTPGIKAPIVFKSSGGTVTPVTITSGTGGIGVTATGVGTPDYALYADNTSAYVSTGTVDITGDRALNNVGNVTAGGAVTIKNTLSGVVQFNSITETGSADISVTGIADVISMSGSITRSGAGPSNVLLRSNTNVNMANPITAAAGTGALNVTVTARATDGTGNVNVGSMTTRGGDISLGGGSTAGGVANRVNINNAAVVDAGGGNISVRGNGLGNSYAVLIYPNAELKTSGAGNIDVSGIIASGSGTGVYLDTGSKLTSDAGNITVTGTSPGWIGVVLTNGTYTSGSGNITITGTGGGTSNGLQRSSSTLATTITSTSGNISLTGRSPAAAVAGVLVAGTGALTATTGGTGSVTMIGEGSGTNASLYQGAIAFTDGTNNAPVTLTSGTGGTIVTATTLGANAKSILSNYTSSFISTGDVTVTGDRDISGLPAVTAGGNITVTSTLGSIITAAITKNGAGTATVTAATNLFVQGVITKAAAGDATMLLRAGGNIDFASGGSVITGPTAGKLDLTLNSRYTDGATGFIRPGSISTNGGNVLLVGGAGGTGNAVAAAGGNAIVAAGTILIDAGGGNILVRATGGGSSGNAINFNFAGSELRTSGTGNIDLLATNNASSSTAIKFAANTKLTAAAGNITVNATYTNATDGNAFYLLDSTISTTTGNISINATATGVAGGFYRAATTSATNITSVSGDISLTGRAGTTGYAGIATESTGLFKVSTGGTGKTTLIGEGGAVAPSALAIKAPIIFKSQAGVITPVQIAAGSGGISVTATGVGTPDYALYADNTSTYIATGRVDITGDRALTNVGNVTSQGGTRIQNTLSGAVNFNSITETGSGDIEVFAIGDALSTTTGNAISRTGAGPSNLLIRSNANVNVSVPISAAAATAPLTVTMKSRYADGTGYVNVGNITSRGGDVRLGGGSAADGYASEVYLIASRTIDAGGGNVWLNGNGGSSVPSIYIDASSEVKTSGAGNIDLFGTGLGSQVAINFEEGAKLTSDAGNINVTGTSVNSASIRFRGGTFTSGSGNITFTGTSTGTGAPVTRTSVATVTTFTSTSGNISLIGRSPAAASFGLFFGGAGAVNMTTGGAGAITLTGEGAGSSGLAYQAAIGFYDGSVYTPVTLTSGTGGTTVTGTTQAAGGRSLYANATGGFNSAGDVTVTGNRDMYVVPNLSASGNILVDTVAGHVETGTITKNGAGTVAVTSDSGNLTVGTVTKTGGGDATATFKAITDVIVNSSSSFVTGPTGGRLNVLINSRFTDGSVGNIYLGPSTTNGGNITLVGGSSGNDYAIGSTHGILFYGGALIDAGGGNIVAKGSSSGSLGNGISIAANAEVRTSGTGNITLDGISGTVAGGASGYAVNLNSGSKITAAAGNILVTGSTTNTASTNFSGIRLYDGTISSTTGNITLTAVSTGAARGFLRDITSGATNITSTGGNVSISGTSAATLGYQGVQLLGTGAFNVTTTGAGSVSLYGQGGAVAQSSTQAAISFWDGTNFPVVTLSSGTGGTTVRGQTTSASAVSIYSSNTVGLFSSTGDVTVTGDRQIMTPTITANGNIRIENETVNPLSLGAINKIGAGTVNATTSGSITMYGTVTKSGAGAATLTYRADGSINMYTSSSVVTNAGAGEIDVLLNSRYLGSATSGTIVIGNTNTNGGDVTLVGDVGGAGAAGQISVQGSSLVNAGGGNILMRGALNGGSLVNAIVLGTSVELRTSGTGNIDLDGTVTANSSDAIYLYTGNKLTAEAGNITVKGRKVSAPAAAAIRMGGATVTTTTGNITFDGQGDSTNVGFSRNDSVATNITSTSGNISIIGRATTAGTSFQGILLQGTGTTTISTGGTGKVSLIGQGGAVSNGGVKATIAFGVPGTPSPVAITGGSGGISITTTAVGTPDYSLYTADSSVTSYTATGPVEIIGEYALDGVGNVTSRGGTTIKTTIAGLINFRSITETGSGNILVDGQGNITSAGSITRSGTGPSNVVLRSTGTVNTTGAISAAVGTGALDVTMTSRTTDAALGYVRSGNITTRGGNITIGGGSATGDGYAAGGTVDGYQTPTSGTLDAGGGNITIQGRSSTQYGVTLLDSSQLITAGTGTITLVGQSSNNPGVRFAPTTRVQTADGNISVTGTALGTYGGINIEAQFNAVATGAGNISFVGTAAGANGNGILRLNTTAATTISSGTGNISLTGRSPNTTTGFMGILTLGTGAFNITTGGAGAVTLFGEGGGTAYQGSQAAIAFTADAVGSTPVSITAGTGGIKVDARATGASTIFGYYGNNVTMNTTGLADIQSTISMQSGGSITAGGGIKMNTVSGSLVAPTLTATGGDIYVGSPTSTTRLVNVTQSGTGRTDLFSGGSLQIQNPVSSTAGGAITLTATAFSITGTVGGNGALTMRTYNVNGTLGVGDSATGTTLLASTLFSGGSRRILDGFSSITIGRDDGTAALSVGTATYTDPVNFIATGTGGTINIIGTATSTGNDILARATGDVTFSSTGVLSGGNVYVASDTGNFINNRGASAIAATGRWIVYSNTPAANTYGNLVSGQKAVWNGSYSTRAPATIPAGNRYVFRFAPSAFGTSPVTLTKIYGETVASASADVTPYTNTFGGMWVADTAADVGVGSVSLVSPGLGALANVGTYALDTDAIGYTSSGYSANLPAGSTLQVDPRAITVTAQADSKVYDGTTTSSAVPLLTSGNLVNGQTATWVQTFDNRNAGTNKTLTASGSVADGNGGNNYAVTFVPSAAGVITQRAITIVTTSGQGKIYGTDDPASAASAYSISTGNLVSGDTLGGSIGRLAGESVGSYAFTQGSVGVADGNSGNNYAVTFDGSSHPFAITQASLTVSLPNQTKVYGADDPSLASITPTMSGAVNRAVTDLNGNVTNIDDRAATSVSLTSLTREIGESVGTRAVTGVTFSALSGSAASNYTGPTLSGSPVLTITQAPLNVSIPNQTKVYGQDDPSLAGIILNITPVNRTVSTWNGSVVVDDTANLSTTLSTLSRAVGEDVGTYAINATLASLGGSSAGNYAVTLTGSPQLTITQAPLTATLSSISKVYGDADPLPSAVSVTLGGVVQRSVVTWNGAVAIDDSSRVGASLTAYARAPGENAGTYSVTGATMSALTGASAGNYSTPALAGSPTFVISQRAITISAQTDTKVYDGTPTSSVTPTLTAGTLATGDALTGLAQSFDSKNAGNRTLAVTPGYVLADGNGGNNYTVTLLTAAGVITPKDLTVTATANDKVYDGTTLATGNLSALTGIITNDDVTFGGTASFAFADKDVGTNKPVTVSGITLSGVDAGNYRVNSTAATTASITQASLIITATNASKVYGDADPALTYTYTGLQGTDTAAVFTGALGRAAGENVGTYAITQNTLSAGGNYAVTFNSANLLITPAQLTVTANPYSKVYGDVDPTFGYVVSGFKNGDTASVISGALARTTGENVGTYAINQGSLSAGSNYTLAYTPNNLTITARAITISAQTQNRVYDGTPNSSLTPTITSGALAGSDTLTGLTQSYDSRNAGNRTLTVNSGYVLSDGNGGNNYAVTLLTAPGVISPKDLTVTVSATDKVYDGTTLANGSIGALSGIISGDNVTTGGSASFAFADKNVGNNKPVTVTGILLTGTDAANYRIDPTATTSASITPAALVITAANVSKVYGDADPTLTYTYTGLQGTDNASVFSGALGRAAGEDAGTYAITLNTLSAGGNYTLSINSANLLITPAQLTVTANPYSKIYGDADPTFGYVISGFRNGDTASVVSGALARTTGENVGTYAINQGTLSAGSNYTLAYTPNNLSITPRNLVVTATDASKVYGDADPQFAFTHGTLYNGDTVAIFSGNLTRTTGENAGNYSITQGTLSAGSNYTVQYTGGQFSITPRMLTIVADARGKAIGDPDPALTFAHGTLVNGDTESIFTGGLTRAPGESLGTYAILRGTLSAGPNYTIDYTGNQFDILAGLLVINAYAQTKVYGDTDPALTYSVSGLRNGDTVSVLSGSLTRDAGENAGSYDINQGTLSAGSNYGIRYYASSLTITPRNLVVTADAATKVYGSTDPTLTYTYGTLVNGDTASVFTGSLGRAAGENAGTYAIGQDTLSAGGNYNVQFTGNDLTITPAALTVSADAQSKIYGELDPTLTYSYQGLVNGDTDGVFSGNLQRLAGETVAGGPYAIDQGTLSAGPNYTISYTGNALSIVPRTLTVGIIDNIVKVYDGTTALPEGLNALQWSGRLGSDDIDVTATLAFDSRNAGRRTIDVSNLTINGADASNYVLSTPTLTGSGSILQRAITVAAQTDTRTYDGSTNSGATPSIVVGSLAAGDTANWVQAFDNRNAGTGKALTPSGEVADGNGGNNYLVSFVSSHDGTIQARPITVSAQMDMRDYDGTTRSSLLPIITEGELAVGDTANFSQHFDSSQPGTNRIILADGTVVDGNNGGNYLITFLSNANGIIVAPEQLPNGNLPSVIDGIRDSTLVSLQQRAVERSAVASSPQQTTSMPSCHSPRATIDVIRLPAERVEARTSVSAGGCRVQ
ncbi:MBG domain-containing protein [Peristeroidobacter soli]|uniref:MBG domain-containing protein n=1 Tax=Peristeroidobacter soli TaxID=2497877 RepID=UPI00101CC612|nr:MBG domain-containing protein [Peristeroidobacter soli]